MEINHKKIENETLDVLDMYNIEGPVVNVVKIAKEKGLEVKEIKMPSRYRDIAGFYNRQEKTIYVNAEDKPSRKLFTIAHELGHIFLKHKNYEVLYRITNDDGSYSDKEREANSFASNLLMPEFMVLDYMEKYDLTRSDYKVMSEIFGVPVVAMKRRLEQQIK